MKTFVRISRLQFNLRYLDKSSARPSLFEKHLTSRYVLRYLTDLFTFFIRNTPQKIKQGARTE